MTKKLTAKRFLSSIKKRVKIKQLCARDFYYYVPNALEDWAAAFSPPLQSIYLKNKQPYIIVFHELVHFIRHNTEGDLELFEFNNVLKEELIAYEAGYMLCRVFGCPAKNKVYHKGWNCCQKLVGKDYNLTPIHKAAQQAVKDLLNLVNKG